MRLLTKKTFPFPPPIDWMNTQWLHYPLFPSPAGVPLILWDVFSCDMRHVQVAEAMLQAAASVNVGGETFITTPTDGGAYVVSAEPKFSEGAIRYPGDV